MIVKSQRAKKAILASLADEEMVKILDSLMFHSKSINDIIRETNIAYTTCYRKTNWLLNEGLLKVDKIVITPEGKKFSQFHSVLKSINVKYEGNEIIVEAEQNFDIIKKILFPGIRTKYIYLFIAVIHEHQEEKLYFLRYYQHDYSS